MDIQTLIERAGGAQKFADLLGCGRTTVLTWRSRRTIPGHRVQQISDALGIPVGDLFPLITPLSRVHNADVPAYA